MSDAIYRELIFKTIDIGKNIDPSKSERIHLMYGLADHPDVRGLLNGRWPFDNEYLHSLTIDELFNFLKGLILIENSLFNGHVSCIPAALYVFKMIIQRDEDMSLIAFDWILRWSKNRYLPFGSAHGKCQSYGAKSLDEYVKKISCASCRPPIPWTILSLVDLKKREEWEIKEHKHDILMIQQQRSSIINKENVAIKREIFKHTSSLNRQNFFKQFNDLDHVERLKVIALDTEHTIDYYPPEYSLIPPEIIDVLYLITVDKLIMKTAKTKIPEWKSLHNLLINRKNTMS